MIRFQLELMHLPLRYAWKLSRNTSTEKTNCLITARHSSGAQGLGEVAPNIRYGESPEKVVAEFASLKEQIETQEFQENWESHLRSLPVCSALKMGLDMARQRCLAQTQNQTLSAFLGLPEPGARPTAYTIPVMEPGEIQGFLQRENLQRFSWLKIKVNQESAADMVKETLKRTTVPLAIDGNEAWKNPDSVVTFTRNPSMAKERILFLEQPLPASQKEDYLALAGNTGIPIWGDESILSSSEPLFWKTAFSGINVKLMKAETLQNAIHQLQLARQIGLETMIGCMVETTVGISAALALSPMAGYVDLDGFLLLENEPFGWIKEENGFIGVS